jgi:hypothetical protein
MYPLACDYRLDKIFRGKKFHKNFAKKVCILIFCRTISVFTKIGEISYPPYLKVAEDLVEGQGGHLGIEPVVVEEHMVIQVLFEVVGLSERIFHVTIYISTCAIFWFLQIKKLQSSAIEKLSYNLS